MKHAPESPVITKCNAPLLHLERACHTISVAVLRWFQELTGKARSDLNQQLHVRALGSYVRGKLDTGDIGECLSSLEGGACCCISPGSGASLSVGTACTRIAHRGALSRVCRLIAHAMKGLGKGLCYVCCCGELDRDVR